VSPPLVSRVAAVFAAGGPLERALDGFEARPGQQRLAEAVADVFHHGGTLVAEAGTGTGKTLAYLVPAVLAGRRVLISTGTRTLQDQIFYKDLPVVSRALGRDVRAAYMKGRTNYLCLHRFDRLGEAAAGLGRDERRWFDQIQEWHRETDTGDRAEIDDLPDDLPLWHELTATGEQCLGRDCSRFDDCFITRMRARAEAADVVVVNHHLLCADAAVRQNDFGEVIPQCDIVVIDEAHQLEDVVTQYFGVSVSVYRVEEFARDASAALALVPPEHGSYAVAISIAISDVHHAARAMFDAARLEGRRRESGDRTVLTPEVADRLTGVVITLAEALDRVSTRIGSQPDPPGGLIAAAGRAEALRADLTLVMSASDSRYVHFIESRGRGLFLRAAPIDASSIIREAVIGSRRSTVMTSATLTVEGAFDYAVARLGVVDPVTLRLPSEFDFRTQAVMYLPTHLPDPRSPDFNTLAASTIADLLTVTEGRAFVLFTSYSAMREVHALLSPVIEWPVFIQGSAPRSALLRDFRATPNAVLLATSSFWQGVDVAGDALSCVIIDRLPFASPGDPLMAARMAAIEARGGHPFHEFQVPLATLTLLQGIGRLIRTRSDRGVIAVLDGRISRMAYGRRFLASLPPAPITDDLAVVRKFFGVRSTRSPGVTSTSGPGVEGT
jgi:ATP-dependent DNA helicase DinG